MRRALIAGGGIAGMAAALALARAGWAVTLCEEAPAPGEVGAGLQVSPNAAKVLRWLGVLDKVAAKASRPQAAAMRNGATGATIFRVPLGERAEARWGAPYLHLHRADLLGMLSEAARAAGVAVETDTRVTGYLVRSGGVRLDRARALPDGGAGERLDPGEGDLALGADGIRSTLRQRLNGQEDPDFTGMVAWRSLVPAERLPEGLVAPDATVWVGPGRHLVTYYLRGRSLVNLVAVEEQGEWTAEGWRHPGDPARLRDGFSGWHGSVTGLLDAVKEVFVWGLFTRPEQVRWADGRMALLGDAAHPMLPFVAQGAGQALEDAVVLARELERAGTEVQAALARYEKTRWPRVARVQARSRANGTMFHRRTRFGRLLAQAPVAAVSRIAPGFAAGRLDWLYGHDAGA